MALDMAKFTGGGIWLKVILNRWAKESSRDFCWDEAS